MKYPAGLLSLCILITACGGGGGGDNGNDNNGDDNNGENCGSQDGNLKITDNNYKTVNAEAYDAVYSVPILADTSAVVLNEFTLLALSGGAGASSTGLAQQAVKSMITRKRLPSHQLSQSSFGGTALPSAVIQDTIGCRDGGQYQITINDADNNNFISDGDAIELDFDNCRINNQGSTVILDNQLTGRLASINDNNPLNRPPYNIRFNYDQFTMQTADQSGTELVRVDGDLRSSASCSSNVECAIRADGDDLTLTQQSSSTTSAISWEVSDYRMESTFNDNDREEEFSGDGALYIDPSSNDFVNFETTSGNSFQLRYSDDYPFAGEQLSTGCNSSTRLTTLDNRNVRLELDENGDDVYETTTTMTWDRLNEERD